MPIDTTIVTPLHRQLLAKGVLNRITIQEVDNNRKQLLKTYPNIVEFKKNYIISPSIVDRIKSSAEADEIKWSDEDFNKSQNIILTQMKALIARDLYEASAFYRIINDIDDIFLKGLEVINDDSLYNSILQGDK